MDETSARALAKSSELLLRAGMSLGEARESSEGWYFPFRSAEPMVGCNGVIVHKRTGKLFHLGSAFPPERDLDLYDRGYQFECYDLVILSVRDLEQTLSSLAKLRFTVVEPEEAHGVVWKIPRAITKAEFARKLDRLPCTMPAVSLYFVAEVLEDARAAGWFTFQIREHVPAPSEP